MKKIKTIILPVTWEMSGTIEVEAKNIAEAINFFNSSIDSINLPTEDNCSYVGDSFRLTDADEDFIGLFNLELEDE